MPTIKLQQVKNFDKLIKYLETELGWPVEGREIDDIAFPFDLEADLGLDKKEVAKVRHVYRLKKMHKKQPFGIFFVDFEGKKMPVSVLKRILRTLALKRRANATAADQLAWDVEDLIFISAVGEEKDASREISFAHFRKEPDNRHVLKVMAWDGGDTPLKMDHLDDVLHEFLRFPDDTNDVDAWRKSWTAAFRTGIRQNIRRSEELAQALAALAMRINKEALSLIKKESANGPLKTLHAGFKDALIHDLTEEAFTDCYAQTITYGLLTAAITKVNQAGVKDLTSTSVLEMVPSTNPFLKDILSSFLEAGGRGQKGIDFDDLGVQDVIDLLRAESTDLPNILRDFGNLTQDEDPVIHFYETFLKIYNKDERVKRGAFYTPRPVVSYIVRSVDELLRKEFGLEDGLADTTTWGEMIKRNPAIKLPPLTDTPGEKKTIKETEPFVQVLDPATGTATFLVEVINVIEKTVKAKAWAKLKKGAYEHDQHSKREEVLKDWNEYVPEHLLKRLHAYEIMMAPYVIAHMKVGLKLAETGYRFATEERARIYLTNALEPAKDFKDRLNFDIPALAIEAKQVNEIKRGKRFTVIIGNPPYSGHSTNNGQWISGLVRDYYFVNGESLGEKNTKWLLDDYVKFIRLGECAITTSGQGVIGYITNHGFIDNPTFRGMRSHMLNSFTKLWALDLHGNAKKAEKTNTGKADENVFDIQQGVAVSLGVRSGGAPSVNHGSLSGARADKYYKLSGDSVSNISWTASDPVAPFYLMVKQDVGLRDEYDKWIKVTEIFPLNGWGIATRKDYLLVDFERKKLVKKFKEIISEPSAKSIAKFEIKESPHWDFGSAISKLPQNVEKSVRPLLFRPFDIRSIYYERAMIERGDHRYSLMRHMFKQNICLITIRRLEVGGGFSHAYCTDQVSVLHSISMKEGNFVFPLYVYPDEECAQGTLLAESERTPNLSHDFLQALKVRYGVSGNSDSGSLNPIAPEDIFGYIYAVLHSPTFRTRYSELLRIDFPRIPISAGVSLFNQLSNIGRRLAEIHMLTSLDEGENEVTYIGRPFPEVKKVTWSNRTVWIDEANELGFKGVSEEVWNFHIGGYQVCRNWLKDRKGRVLSDGEVKHYTAIAAAISKTIRLMAEVDESIIAHGGWPKAFQ